MVDLRGKAYYRLAIEIESEYSNVLVEISEEETKEQQYFFDKQLLNLFKQTMLIIHYSLASILRVKLSNSNFKFFIFLPLRFLRPYFLANLVFLGTAF